MNKWRDIEYILVLYLYLYKIDECKKNSDFIIDFAKRLNDYTGIERTPSSIYMRLQNYVSVDPNKNVSGLGGGYNTCKKFWDEYYGKEDFLEKEYIKFMKKTDSIKKETFNEEIREIDLNKKYSIEEKNAFIEMAYNVRNPQYQKYFKDELKKEFKNKCALCEINDNRILYASHIIPYCQCDNKSDMMNPNNGLLLCVNHDALFDKLLITFDNNGKIIISKTIDTRLYEFLNISTDLNLDKKFLNNERFLNLKFHRKLFNKKNK